MEKVLLNETRQQLILIEAAVESADMGSKELQEAITCALQRVIDNLEIEEEIG